MTQPSNSRIGQVVTAQRQPLSHVELDLAVRGDVGPEQRCQPAPVLRRQRAGPGRLGENVLPEQGVAVLSEPGCCSGSAAWPRATRVQSTLLTSRDGRIIRIWSLPAERSANRSRIRFCVRVRGGVTVAGSPFAAVPEGVLAGGFRLVAALASAASPRWVVVGVKGDTVSLVSAEPSFSGASRPGVPPLRAKHFFGDGDLLRSSSVVGGGCEGPSAVGLPR